MVRKNFMIPIDIVRICQSRRRDDFASLPTREASSEPPIAKYYMRYHRFTLRHIHYIIIFSGNTSVDNYIVLHADLLELLPDRGPLCVTSRTAFRYGHSRVGLFAAYQRHPDVFHGASPTLKMAADPF
jgi:hypothetical protein